MSWCWIYFE